MLKRISLREDGATMVEFALILPLLVTLIFGIIEMGLLFNAWVSVQHAAELGARYAVTGQTACASGGSGRTGCIVSEARSGVASLSGGNAATVTLTSWAYPDYTSSTPNSAGNQCDAVEVRVRYVYHTSVPLIAAVFNSVTLTGAQRFINEPFGLCTAS